MGLAKTRILWLTEYFYPNRGGMATSCDRIVKNLRKSGIEVDVCHFTDRLKAWTEKKEEGGRYFCIPPEETASHTLNLCWRFLNHPKRKATYTHVLAFGGHLSMLGGPVFAAWWKLPFILCLRGNDFDVGVFSSKKQHVLERAVTRSAAVCCVSDEKRAKVKALWPGVAAFFTPNGADFDDWQALPSHLEQAQAWRTERLAPGQKALGLFGALKAKKGLTVLLKALNKPSLKEKIHLLMVGELEEGMQDFLEENGFLFDCLPFMDRYELLSWYPACDAVALPSWYDGMPNVALEAMSLGIPVIGTEIDGIADLLQDVTPGMLFPAGDAMACRTIIRNWLDADDSKLSSWKETLPAYLQANFSAAQETQHYREIFTFTQNLQPVQNTDYEKI